MGVSVCSKGTIEDVSALKKKYFLMELNFGVDVSNLKDWLDVDSHTATEILDEFCKSSKSKDSSTRVYVCHEIPFCVLEKFSQRIDCACTPQLVTLAYLPVQCERTEPHIGISNVCCRRGGR